MLDTPSFRITLVAAVIPLAELHDSRWIILWFAIHNLIFGSGPLRLIALFKFIKVPQLFDTECQDRLM